MYSKQTRIVNESGLHARPAADFVKTAKGFAARVWLSVPERQEEPPVNAKSMVMVLSLGLGKGSAVQISAEGADAAAAVDTLTALVDSGFGEVQEVG